jgi:DNA-binding FadR family transcriptional regulator
MSAIERRRETTPVARLSVRVPKTAELVAGQLRAQIIRGELKDGDTLPPEVELVERYGISRPTLREAYRVLESESLISVRRGARGGARVHTPSIDVAARNAGWVLEHRGTTMADLYEARIVIEVPCAGRLAQTRTTEQIDRLWAGIHAAEAAIDDPDRFIRSHTDFHALIVEMAGNQTLAVLNGMVRQLIDLANWTRLARDHGGTTPRAVHRGAKAHRLLVEHIEAQDADAATELWRVHLVEAEQYLLEGPGARTLIELLG